MNSFLYNLIFTTIIILFSFTSFADGSDTLNKKVFTYNLMPFEQKSKIGWEISGNFGVYNPNKYQAKFYNGTPGNVNSLDYILSNYYWNQEIINQLIQYEQRDSFLVSEYPPNIKYDASMYVGFSARYNYSDEIALNISFNFSKLQVKDIIACEVYPPFPGMVQSYVYFNIFGQEGRTNMDIGGMYTLHPEKNLTPFAEMGLNLNSTHVKKHILNVYDREFNMVNIYGSSGYIPNTPVNEYTVYQGGIGFGTYISGGWRYVVNNQLSMELAAIVYLKTVNLEGYSKRFGLHESVLFRIVMSPFYNFSGEEQTIE